MTVQALLVTRDDSASEILGRTLPTYGIAVERWSDPSTAITRLQQQKFDALVVDFDDPEAAPAIIPAAPHLKSSNPPPTSSTKNHAPPAIPPTPSPPPNPPTPPPPL